MNFCKHGAEGAGYSLKWVFWVKNQFLKTKVFSKFLTQKAPFRRSKSPPKWLKFLPRWTASNTSCIYAYHFWKNGYVWVRVDCKSVVPLDRDSQLDIFKFLIGRYDWACLFDSETLLWEHILVREWDKNCSLLKSWTMCGLELVQAVWEQRQERNETMKDSKSRSQNATNEYSKNVAGAQID